MKLRTTQVGPSRTGVIGKFKAHARTLSPGDTLIAGILGALLIGLLLAGLHTLERQFLVEVPSHGGSLTEGAVGAPRFVNPLLALSDTDRDLSTLTYAGLMGYDADGVLVPVLAESYEVSEDGKSYTFRLRGDAEFSDGTPVTAEDVVFTVEKLQDPGLKSPRLADFANISVEAVDSRTVRFTLPRAYAPFLAEASLGILPAHLWKDVSNEEFPFSEYMAEPVGAGPFTVAHVIRDKNGVVERYELRSNERYALGRPYLERISFVYFPDEEALAEALARGRVESAYGVPREGALSRPYSRIFGVFLNQSKNPALASLPVRKALSVAIDRDALVREVLGGYATPAYGPVPPGMLPLGTLPPEPPTDPIAEASAILEDAGWVYDGDARTWTNEKEGLTLAVTLTTSTVPELRAVADYLRESWGRLGVQVAIELHDPSTLITGSIRPREYEALFFGMVIGADKDLFAFWDSGERNDPGLNVSMYTNRAVDELLDELRAESDPAAKEQMLIELDTLIAEEYPAVFTHAPNFLYAVPQDLRGIVLGTIAAPSDRFLSAASWYRHTEFVWPALAGGR